MNLNPHVAGNLVLAAFLALASGSALAQTASVDFAGLGDAPVGPAALGNGVDVSVAGTGHWEHITVTTPHYDHYTFRQGQTQTWTFSEPVNLSFTILGLNCGTEGVQFSGTPVTADSLHASHSWNDATQTVNGNNSPGDAVSSFSASNTTTLTLTAVAGGTCRRGLGSMTVTRVATPPTGTVAPVPVDSPVALATTALMLGGLAGTALRRRRARHN